MSFGRSSLAALFVLAFVASAPCIAAGSDRMRDAIEILDHIPAGNRLIRKALQTWKYSEPADLLKVLRWGDSSRTDAVLTRFLNPRTGIETRERQLTIYLREGQSLENLVLDIAHELVHATSRPAWDPYDEKLTMGRYIHTAIEGEGGEVEAVIAECQVGMELSNYTGSTAKRCRGYFVTKNEGVGKEIDREKVLRDFYRIGKWNDELVSKLGAEKALFPFLSMEQPLLFSSTGQAPYPIALYREFVEITEIACQNSKKRLRAFAERKPAADDLAQGDTNRFIATRCKGLDF